VNFEPGVTIRYHPLPFIGKQAPIAEPSPVAILSRIDLHRQPFRVIHVIAETPQKEIA
jgi:hypothetical protein